MLSERLLKLRKEARMTQVELSSKLGIARTTYSGYELGTSEPDNDTLEMIADFYGVTIDNLLGREPKEHTEETEDEKEDRFILETIKSIEDPETKKAAIEVLKGLAGRNSKYPIR